MNPAHLRISIGTDRQPSSIELIDSPDENASEWCPCGAPLLVDGNCPHGCNPQAVIEQERAEAQELRAGLREEEV